MLACLEEKRIGRKNDTYTYGWRCFIVIFSCIILPRKGKKPPQHPLHPCEPVEISCIDLTRVSCFCHSKKLCSIHNFLSFIDLKNTREKNKEIKTAIFMYVYSHLMFRVEHILQNVTNLRVNRELRTNKVFNLFYLLKWLIFGKSYTCSI